MKSSIIRTFSLFMISVFLLYVITPCAYASNYTDVPDGEWYADAVAYVTEHGLMGGIGNGKFAPNQELTRAQIVELLYRLAGNPETMYTNQFQDVSNNAWFAKSVAWANGQGIVNGTSNNTFSPLSKITRESYMAATLTHKQCVEYIRNIKDLEISIYNQNLLYRNLIQRLDEAKKPLNAIANRKISDPGAAPEKREVQTPFQLFKDIIACSLLFGIPAALLGGIIGAVWWLIRVIFTKLTFKDPMLPSVFWGAGILFVIVLLFFVFVRPSNKPEKIDEEYDNEMQKYDLRVKSHNQALARRDKDITPFKNILNDMYSRDISKKVLAGRMTRSRQGKFCGGPAPLGLKRDPDDHGHLIIDPETAPVIKTIYDLALNGMGAIKGILTEQRFLRMTETLEQEQAENKVRMQAITEDMRTASSADSDVRRFIEEIREYASITELDETILNRLIDKIYISAVEVIDGEKVQKVRIIYNFVGEIAN